MSLFNCVCKWYRQKCKFSCEEVCCCWLTVKRTGILAAEGNYCRQLFPVSLQHACLFFDPSCRAEMSQTRDVTKRHFNLISYYIFTENCHPTHVTVWCTPETWLLLSMSKNVLLPVQNCSLKAFFSQRCIIITVAWHLYCVYADGRVK